MDVCLPDRFNFFIIVPNYLPVFFLLVLSSYLLNFSFYAIQSGFFLILLELDFLQCSFHFSF